MSGTFTCVDCERTLPRPDHMTLRAPKRCAECARLLRNAKAREKRRQDPEKSREVSRKNMEKRRREQPQAVKQTKIRSTYQITDEQYESLLKRAKGKCELCGTILTDDGPSREVIDHNHETGSVRGLLCNNCNMGLGYVADSGALLEQLAQYLENPPGIQT
jgi:hypothetical protein